MNKVVLDCSAAVNIVRETPEGQLMAPLLGMAEIDEVLAPQLLYAEVASALSKYYRAGMMDESSVAVKAEGALRLVNTFVSHDELYVEALSESLRQGHSVYDMFYLVLARRHDAILLTGDRRLRELCRKMGVRCSGRAWIKPGCDSHALDAWEFE